MYKGTSIYRGLLYGIAYRIKPIYIEGLLFSYLPLRGRARKGIICPPPPCLLTAPGEGTEDMTGQHRGQTGEDGTVQDGTANRTEDVGHGTGQETGQRIRQRT